MENLPKIFGWALNLFPMNQEFLFDMVRIVGRLVGWLIMIAAFICGFAIAELLVPLFK